MAASRVFHDISPPTWLRIKSMSEQGHGTSYSGSCAGTAVTATPVGAIRIAYSYDASRETVEYTIIERPRLVAEFLIWSRIEQTLAECRTA
jgi:hypothetical protein